MNFIQKRENPAPTYTKINDCSI